MFNSLINHVAAAVRGFHLCRLAIAFMVVACLCQVSAAQEPFIGQIYMFYGYSGENALRYNMFSETGMPVRATFEPSSTAQTAMSFQLKKSPLTHSITAGQPSIVVHPTKNGGELDWTKHTKSLAGRVDGKQGIYESRLGSAKVYVGGHQQENSRFALSRGYVGSQSQANGPTSIPVVPNGPTLGFSKVPIGAHKVRPAVPAMRHISSSR